VPDPLLEIEAKRRILEECTGELYDEHPEITDRLNLRVLVLLALPYADHPDYQPEWNPT
jgi:hypothetical protein